MAGEMLYHHTKCGQLGPGQVLTPGKPCPQCGKTVPDKLVEWTCDCDGKQTTWMSDLAKEVGDRFLCPIHNKPVVVTSATHVKSEQPPPSVALLVLVGLLIALLAVVVRDTWGTPTFTPTPNPTFTPWPTPTFTPWPTPTSTATWTPTPTPWFVPPECDVALLLGQVLDGLVVVLLVALFIGILYLLFKATAWLAGRPTQTLEQLDRLSDDAPVRSIADESRRTITEQNDWVSGLLVLVIVVATWCRLDADSFAQVSDAARQMVVQRMPAILMLSILLSAIPFYQELSGTSILANVPLAAFISGMFGVGSVTTVIAAPLLFGAPPGEVAMTELAINAVVDICLNFQRERLRRWYDQMRWRE